MLFLTASENTVSKLKPSKCEVFRTEINYLAHHVSKKGVQPSKKNLESIAQCPPPDTYTKVKSFVGLVGHYRHFIKGFARIAAPLYDLTSGENKDKKSERVDLPPKLLRLLNTLRRPVFRPPFWLFPTSINRSSSRRTRLVKASGLFFLKNRLMDATILSLMRVEL